MKKVFENAVWWSGVVTVGLILGISLQFVRAWTEPTAAPPNGNVGAPINTSDITQIKNGVLGLIGLVTNTLSTNTLSTNTFQMPTGAANGYVLTTDVSGTAIWAPPSGGTTVIENPPYVPPVYTPPVTCNGPSGAMYAVGSSYTTCIGFFYYSDSYSAGDEYTFTCNSSGGWDSEYRSSCMY